MFRWIASVTGDNTIFPLETFLVGEDISEEEWLPADTTPPTFPTGRSRSHPVWLWLWVLSWGGMPLGKPDAAVVAEAVSIFACRSLRLTTSELRTDPNSCCSCEVPWWWSCASAWGSCCCCVMIPFGVTICCWSRVLSPTLLGERAAPIWPPCACGDNSTWVAFGTPEKKAPIVLPPTLPPIGVLVPPNTL